MPPARAKSRIIRHRVRFLFHNTTRIYLIFRVVDQTRQKNVLVISPMIVPSSQVVASWEDRRAMFISTPPQINISEEGLPAASHPRRTMGPPSKT